MRAVYVTEANRDEPLNALQVGDRPEPPSSPDTWTTVQVRATSLNHHDLFSLRGVGLHQRNMPMILGTDAAGVDENGNDVIVYPVICSPEWRGDETLDPSRTLLSELHQGTFADRVTVPRANLLPKPSGLSFAEAACLPSAWLTAYRMLFVKSGLLPGQTILVQGASGGVSTALIMLGAAAGFRMWATGRTEAKRRRALELGAAAAFEPNQYLPERVDGVMESVGEVTWEHSLKVLKPGGVIVISGATTGFNPPAALNRIFFRQLRVVGSTMGTQNELESLISMCLQTGIRPPIAAEIPLPDAREAFKMLLSGETDKGKLVLQV